MKSRFAPERFPLPTAIDVLPWKVDYELESGKQKSQYDDNAEYSPNPLASHGSMMPHAEC
jgi:hypothetical protein